MVFVLISCSTDLSNLKVLEEVKKDPIGLNSDEIVINTYFDEVIRSKEINRIDLVAKKENAPFFSNLVIIIDGSRYPLESLLKGYNPELKLADLNFDGIKDLLITIRSGETDRSLFFSVNYFKQREFQPMFPSKNQNGIVPIELIWNTNFEMQIQSLEYNFMIRKRLEFPNITFVRSKIGISKYQDLQPIDIDSDGQYELVGLQSIWLKLPHHVVFQLKTILKYSSEKWQLFEYQFNPVKLIASDTVP